MSWKRFFRFYVSPDVRVEGHMTSLIKVDKQNNHCGRKKKRKEIIAEVIVVILTGRDFTRFMASPFHTV